MTGAQNGTDPDRLAVDWQEILDYQATLWAQQLATANSEAARWRSAALQAQRTVAELTRRVETLEALANEASDGAALAPG